MGFPRQGAGAIEITVSHRCLRLLHKLSDLIDHVLLIRAELASGNLLKVFFRGPQHLVGSVPLWGRLITGRAPSQRNAWI